MIADLLDRLEHIADEPVVPLAPDRVTRIESDLRAMYPLRPHNRRPQIRVRVAVATAIAAVLALVVLNVSDQPVHRTDLRLTSASNTVVVLPDGTRLTGRAGLELPDGATVIVAPGGNATIGDVVIAGGSTAIIDDGAVDVRRSPARTSATGTGVGGGGETANSPRGQTPTTGSAAPPTTGGSATPPPPPVTRPPTATTTPVTRPPTTAAPTTVAPRRAAATAARLRASATRRGDRVVVRWQTFPDKARVSYAVVAAPENETPQYPPGSGSAVVARTKDDTTATISARAGMRLRVVALSDDNRVLARSAVLTPAAGS